MSFSKRNELLKQEKCTEKVRKYSIKKLGIGVASVLIGSIFYLGTGGQAQADEISTSELIAGITNKMSLKENESNKESQVNESVATSVAEKTEDTVGGSTNTGKETDTQISEVVSRSEKTEDTVDGSANIGKETDTQVSEVVSRSEKTENTVGGSANTGKETDTQVSEVASRSEKTEDTVGGSANTGKETDTQVSEVVSRSERIADVVETSASTGSGVDIRASEALETPEKIENNTPISLDKVSNGKFDEEYKSSKNNWEFKEGNNSYIISEQDNKYAKIDPGTIDEHILQKISTVSGKTYSLHADVKIDSDKIEDGMYLVAKSVVNGKQGPVIKQIKIIGVQGEWAHKSFDFTATTSETYIGLVKWADKIVNNVVSASASIDNVTVKENDKYHLVWEDNFSDEELNQKDWGYELGSIRGNEQEHYTDSKDNVFIKDGNLVLKVTNRKGEDQYTNPRGGSNAREVIYDSGSVRTAGKREFLYGRIEMRAKLPKGKGAFPAFWTLGSDFTLDGDISSNQGYGWPSTGEIDIMELIGAPTEKRDNEQAEGDQSNRKIYGTPHFYYKDGDGDKDGSYAPYALGGSLSLNEDFYNNFHVFGINWTSDKIEWYVDGIVYNTMNLSGDERLEAAAACFNKPQYIQLNLATGGNWAKNAGFYLGKDNTEFVIDYVRYYQNEEQKLAAEAYYSSQPQITGTKDITMIEGTTPNLLEGVNTDKEGYTVEFSVDDEYMYKNTGGNTNVTLRVKDSKDKIGLSQLEPGIYNIYYSAIPSGNTLGLLGTPTNKIGRKLALLTILPKEGLVGKIGEKLSTVSLPAGWEWENGNQKIGSADSYKIKYKKSGRTIYSVIDASFIKKEKEERNLTPIINIENKVFDGTKETAINNSKDLQSSLPAVMDLENGTVTIRYRLDTKDSVVRNSSVMSLLSISNKNAEKEYATFFIDTKNNKIGIEFKGKPIVKVGSGFNFLSNSDWQTISYVFNGKTLKVYLNGEMYGESEFTGFLKDLLWKNQADTVTMGGIERKYEGKPAFQWMFEGIVDQASIIGVPLNSSEITKLHQLTNRESVGEKTSLWDKYDEGVFEYRIPSIVKTPQGTLIAASDARKKHYNDWGDISTVVRISHDNGKTWSENITVLDMPTQPYYTDKYSKADWNTNMTQSAFSIDPTLLTDSDGKLYLLVDVFPESQGAVSVKSGSGYEKINDKYYLNLYDFDNNKYTVRENGVVYDNQGTATDMFVDEGEFSTAFSTRGNLYRLGKNNQENTLLGNIYLRSGRNINGITKNGSKTAPLFTHMASFLWLFTSEDQGRTWSAPTDLTPQVKEEWMGFIGTGAAAGIEVKVTNVDGSKAKRLVFPIYYTNQQGNGVLGRQSSANIYSDDGGVTWHRGESPNDGRIFGNNQHTNSKDFNTSVTELTENQIIQLNNGHLLQFMRNTGKTIVIGRSTDYGETWDDNVFVSDLPEPYVNLSAIHFELDGKEYVALSNPLGNPTGEAIQVRNQRIKGVLRIGEILSDDSIKWLSSKVYEPKRFAYSSLVQLDKEHVGVVYEYNGHLKYSTFNVKDMVSEATREDKVVITEIAELKSYDEFNIIPSANKKYVQVQFNQPVFIAGSRQLDISIGNRQTVAEYLLGDGTNNLIFAYSLQENDNGRITVRPTFASSIVENKYGISLLEDSIYTIGFIGEIVSGADITEMFNNKYNDNTWVFIGGEAVQGDFNQTKGIRNFVGQFEEYIRWTKSGNEMGRQRYVINTARSGLNLHEIVSDYEELVSNYSPKAVGYMLDKEDYALGDQHLNDYKNSLIRFIDKSLKLHNDQGFVVLQTPYVSNSESTNELIRKYVLLMKQVVDSYSTNNRINRIVFVNYFELTNTDEFKNHCLEKDGTINARGHFELGKLLSEATIGTSQGYPGNNVQLNLNEKDAPKTYLNIVPEAYYDDHQLFVKIPLKNDGETEWKYELIINNETISDIVKGNSFSINLTRGSENSNYDLIIKSKDGLSQLKVITGILSKNVKSQIKSQELNKNQIRLKELLENKETINWLFMGDSITHAAAWTFGYDGITQLFEKFLVDDLHREKDVVINTAVSGATVASTLAQIDQRLEKYNPDVISIMLGTNDVANMNLTPLQFKDQLQQLVERARAKNAIVILRTPTPSTQPSRIKRIPEFIEVIQQISKENEELIFVDQYTPFKELLDKYPYLWNPDYHFITDGIPLHPGANGQVMLTKLFIESLGLKQYGGYIESLEYKLGYEKQNLEIEAPISLDIDNNVVSLDKDKLRELVNDELSDVMLVAKEKNTNKENSICDDKRMLLLGGLDVNKEYEIYLSAKSSTKPVIYNWAKYDLIVGNVTRNLSLKHNGGYVSRYTITWEEVHESSSGEIINEKKEWIGNGKDILLGNVSNIGISSKAQNIQIKIEECTGIASEWWKTIFEKEYSSLNNDLNLEIAGTTLHPRIIKD
ncbi:GDSL-type esterase/lipase family protein [Enterococcus gallinarum]|uniref:GDSL-type esterase/lipase family protein n=1 Tax=Enterococcus gallinarum TaxID=1353 RepID=UPI001F5A3ED5|nr:GDSL-type esterase/lipase family protein [Enterococcus gallinarum]MCR1946184.1 family 16 glycosylhydrolase [Enterococcus gallinarum]